MFQLARTAPITSRRVIVAAAASTALLFVTSACSPGAGAAPTGGTSRGAVPDPGLVLFKPSDRQRAAVADGPTVMGSGTATTRHPGKVVVINVWASWCGPCRKEAPDLAAASRSTAKVARFVGLNIRDQRDAARAFSRAVKMPYPSIFDPQGQQLVKFSGQLSTTAIPTTLVIDKQQRSAARITGPVDRDTLIQLIDDTANGR